MFQDVAQRKDLKVDMPIKQKLRIILVSTPDFQLRIQLN